MFFHLDDIDRRQVFFSAMTIVYTTDVLGILWLDSKIFDLKTPILIAPNHLALFSVFNKLDDSEIFIVLIDDD